MITLIHNVIIFIQFMTTPMTRYPNVSTYFVHIIQRKRKERLG
jgi:hypothetical protein